MKLPEIKPILSAAQSVQDAVRLIGLHGIGKTDIIKEWAKENDYHLEILLLSNQEVGDIVGIPINKEINGVTVETWSVPIWLQRMRDAAFPDCDIDDLEFRDPKFKEFVFEKIKSEKYK